MNDCELTADLEELDSAEEFLDYFDIEYEPQVVQVNRLHILQRFHDYLEAAGGMPQEQQALRAAYTALLLRAYEDFVRSDALTEKVFKVFRTRQAGEVLVPVSVLKKEGEAGQSSVVCP